MIAGSLIYNTKLDTKGFDNELNDIDTKIEKATQKGITKGILMAEAFKIAANAISQVVKGVGEIAVASVNSYASLEQNIGGVETLFKDSANVVIENANKAYETAGMSANEYMETVTSFSASLLQSLNGDTKKAAEYADRAIIDMSDNANKMGTDMSLIQNAYQGFAKQNYTMLDNLKLGYGGTQEEMKRLIKDASKLTDVQKELGVTVDANDMSFGNIVNAISVMQSKMDIAGTTAKEAATTISGSIGSMKSAWDNFLNGSGDMSALVSTAQTAVQNIINAVSKLLPELISQISGAMPQILSAIDELFPQIANLILEHAPVLISSLLGILSQIIQKLIEMAPQIIEIIIQLLVQIINALVDFTPKLIQMIPKLIKDIISSLTKNLPQIVKAGVELIVALTQRNCTSYSRINSNAA